MSLLLLLFLTLLHCCGHFESFKNGKILTFFSKCVCVSGMNVIYIWDVYWCFFFLPVSCFAHSTTHLISSINACIHIALELPMRKMWSVVSINSHCDYVHSDNNVSKCSLYHLLFRFFFFSFFHIRRAWESLYNMYYIVCFFFRLRSELQRKKRSIFVPLFSIEYRK